MSRARSLANRSIDFVSVGKATPGLNMHPHAVRHFCATTKKLGPNFQYLQQKY